MEAAPTAAQREDAGKLANLWIEAYDEAGIDPSRVTLHLKKVLALIGTLIEGTSWALRRAAAFSLVELREVAKVPLDADPSLTAELMRLAAVLQEKKWRDKEDFLGKVSALIPQDATPAATPAPVTAEPDGPDSADM